ncbi:hypothetical protein PC112_g6269 [Phytophthora cactorum]|nr:hypothetical protein PC112_g6269 [Phytophthora cactorum]
MERQQKLAEALETLVQARIKQQMAEFSALSNPKLGRCFTGRALDFRADINDFKGLLAELEKARREVGAVFAANRLNTTESSHHGVQLRSKKGANGMHLEVFANKAMPFNVRDTAEATWDHFKGMKKHGGNGNLYDKAAKSLDTPYTIIEDYAKELFANTARADVRVKQIDQKSRQNDAQQLTTGTLVPAAQIPSMWQTIAESQRRRREGSELENVRLKLIVDRQRKVADNLQTLLQKRASQLVSECTKKHASNDSIYEKAARNLDEPYTIIEEFTKELYSNSSRADIKVKQVVATQQRRRRNEAEGENARLRLAVQRQQKVADDLKSLLQRKARQLSNDRKVYRRVQYDPGRLYDGDAFQHGSSRH